MSHPSSESENTPLYAACRGGHIEIVELLLDRIADMSKCSGKNGDTPLIAAIKYGHTHTAKM